MYFPAIDSIPSSTQPINLNIIPSMSFSAGNGEAVSSGSYPMQRNPSGQTFFTQSTQFGVSPSVSPSTSGNQSINMGFPLIPPLSSHSSSSSHLPPVSSNVSVVMQQVGFDKNAYTFYDLPECRVRSEQSLLFQ